MIFNSNTMDLNFVNAVGFLTFPSFSQYPFIKHSFSTRLGGVSKGIYMSMNLNFNRGDDDQNVRENFLRICDAVGYDPKTLVAGSQDHHTFIRRVGKEQYGIGIYKEKDMLSVDGLVTNEKNVTLVTYYADCVPLFFLDPVKKVVGLAHAGWRGTVGRIGEKMIYKMRDEFDCSPCNIIVGIGPSISKKCYEVDKDVANEFLALDDLDTSKFVEKTSDTKYHIDLKETNKRILLKAGVQENNITVSDVCTNCYHDLLISHRATKGQRGGMAAMICIMED